jgi:signal transduction histidine kinase/CheY-like chemotaxis protein
MGGPSSRRFSKPADRRRSVLVATLAALTVLYALGAYLLPRQSIALHAWSDFGWLIMTIWAAVESWLARGVKRAHRLACAAFVAANVAWMLAMIAWIYDELVLNVRSPFPTWADAGFIGYAPLYVVGIYFLAGGARSLSLSLRHTADLGIAVATMLFCAIVIYYRPAVELGLPPNQVAVALGYPVAFLSATAFGLLAMLQRPAHARTYVLGLHLGALTVLAIAYTLYGVAILTRKYETGHVLDPFWFAGLALSIWAMREDKWLPYEAASPDDAIVEPTVLDGVLPALACTLPALVLVAYRDDLRHVPAALLAATSFVFVCSLGLRGIAVWRLERELRRTIQERERELLSAQKLEAVNTLAGGLAHDFNNLLTGIMAAAGLLRRKLAAHDRPSELVDLIDQSALRASELTRRLLSLSRGRGETPRGVVDIAGAVRRAGSLLRASISPSIEIVMAKISEGAKVWGNEGEIEQILLNLGLNGAHAMPDGGALEVEVERLHRSVVIRVRDHGCGIPESARRRIFEPFFTTRAPGEGTGLGLAMVRALVKDHGGKVRFESNDGRGTTFEIELPETDRPGPASLAREEEVENRSLEFARGSETVLVVDDRDAPLIGAKVILEAAGYKALAATRAREALEIWNRRRDIALVLTDLNMPEMNGSALLAELRKRGYGGPAILMSGYVDELAKAPGDFTSRLDKPFTAGRLATAVRAALDGAAQDAASRATG